MAHYEARSQASYVLHDRHETRQTGWTWCVPSCDSRFALIHHLSHRHAHSRIHTKGVEGFQAVRVTCGQFRQGKRRSGAKTRTSHQSLSLHCNWALRWHLLTSRRRFPRRSFAVLSGVLNLQEPCLILSCPSVQGTDVKIHQALVYIICHSLHRAR